MKKITLIILFLGPIAVSLKAQTANTNSPDRVRQNERRGDAVISTNFQNGESPNRPILVNDGGQHFQKQPIIVSDAPTIFNNVQDPYRSYAQQGNAMYINNSMFYNKDNFMLHANPVGNGHYTTPGNSNPINAELYREPEIPSRTIYSGHIRVRQY